MGWVTNIISGLVGASAGIAATFFIKRLETARQLLNEGMAISALEEAWIVEGPEYNNVTLSEERGITDRSDLGATWLRKVEVRAVLDEAQWNLTNSQSQLYRFIGGRRACIVRDKIIEAETSYRVTQSVDYRPSLLSSKGIEELCAWIERVTDAWNKWMLSSYGLEMLRPILKAISGEDRVKVFGDRLSSKAVRFLENYREVKFIRVRIYNFLYRKLETLKEIHQRHLGNLTRFISQQRNK